MKTYTITVDAMVTIHPERTYIVVAPDINTARGRARSQFNEDLSDEFGWVDYEYSTATVVEEEEYE